MTKKTAKNSAAYLDQLFSELSSRANSASHDQSYTAYLLSLNEEKISKKIMEEAFELAAANMNLKANSKQEIILEACDVIYHLMVLLISRNIDFSAIVAELEKRAEQKKSKAKKGDKTFDVLAYQAKHNGPTGLKKAAAKKTK